MSEQLSSLPRPVLIAIVGGLAAVALLFVSHRRGQETVATPPAPTQTEQSGTQSKSGTQTQGKQATPEKADPSARTLPGPVKSALDAHKVVAVMFYNPKSPDDLSVKRSVEGISTRGGKVATFTDKFDNVARYTRLTGQDATVNQTPTVIVVDAHGNGRMAVGFQDEATVDQLVVDALK